MTRRRQLAAMSTPLVSPFAVGPDQSGPASKSSAMATTASIGDRSS
jgi:hypothetical protein